MAHVTIAAALPGSRAVTAPGLRGIKAIENGGAGKKKKRDADDDDDNGPVKKKVKRNQAQRLRDQLAKARAANAGGDAPTRGPGNKGGPKGGGKGDKGGKSGLPDGAKWRTTVGDKPICFKWNTNKTCPKDPCTFEHVCWICEKTNHRGCEHRAR